MSANSLQYPEREFECKCGRTVRVRTSLDAASAFQRYEHCVEDEGRLLPPIIGVQEKHAGEWVPVRN
jgi:hypothetical protein